MSFEDALTIELEEIEGLMDKVFPLNAEEGTKAPYVIYVSSEGEQDKTLDGYLPTRDVDAEINVLQHSYSGMKYLTKQVLSKLISFQSRYIGGTEDIYIKSVTYRKPVELYEEQALLYRSVIEFTVNIGGKL